MALTIGGTPRTTLSRNNSVALGCGILFLLPFAGVGVFTAIMAGRAATDGRWQEMAFLTLFSLVFGSVGFGGIGGLFYGRRALEATEKRRAAAPDEPWRWRPDWASGRIEETGRGGAVGLWVFAVFWNLIAMPAAVLGVRAAIEQHKPGAFFVLLFPLVGIGLIVAAVRASIRRAKFGVSVLRLRTNPGVIGRTFEATIHARQPLSPRDGFTVTLTCVRRRTTGSGKNRSTSESVLWQETLDRVTANREGADRYVIPVTVHLPADVQPCDDSDSNDVVLWRLAADAAVPGVDYASRFEVPVFRTAESDAPIAAAEAAAVAAPPTALAPGSRIVVTPRGAATEIYYPAARNKGAAWFITVFALGWSAAVYFLARSTAGLFFVGLFALSDLALLLGAIMLWLKTTRVTMDRQSVTVQSGVFGIGTTREVRAADVAEITIPIGMQSGETPFYDVTIVTRDGKKIKAGTGVRNKRDAEFLVAKLREVLGVSAPPR